MSVKYSSVSSCSDWFYVGRGVQKEAIVFPVAAWGITEDGDVIGLISVPATDLQSPPHLLTPPPIGGCYKPREHLSEDERVSAAKAG